MRVLHQRPTSKSLKTPGLRVRKGARPVYNYSIEPWEKSNAAFLIFTMLEQPPSLPPIRLQVR